MEPAPTLSNTAAATAKPTGTSSADKRSWFYDVIAFFLESGIKIWVRTTGKRMREAEPPWLGGPLGERGRIGTGIYERISRAENLKTKVPPSAALIPT